MAFGRNRQDDIDNAVITDMIRKGESSKYLYPYPPQGTNRKDITKRDKEAMQQTPGTGMISKILQNVLAKTVEPSKGSIFPRKFPNRK